MIYHYKYLLFYYFVRGSRMLFRASLLQVVCRSYLWDRNGILYKISNGKKGGDEGRIWTWKKEGGLIVGNGWR